MDVDLQSKYKLPDADSEAARGDKKRSKSGPPSEGKGGATSSTPENNGKGGKGNGKGRGKGKKGGGKKGSQGKDGDEFGPHPFDDETFTATQMLNTSHKLVSRLCRERREHLRWTQYAFKIPSGDPLVAILLNTQKIWKETRPSSGRHPDGELYEVSWLTAHQNLIERMESSECITAEQKSLQLAIRDFLKLTIRTSQPPFEPGSRATALTKFQPAGRAGRPPPGEGRPWVWVLAFQQDRSKGREAHEEAAHIAPSFKLAFDIEITPDSGPRDNLEFALERQLAVMAL